ncbi:hypothetical protein lerEdw1_002250 [Lerista edwardsae]|nr:hypothetical protein lerEdw1_002250 [Lerista edwardsae]
MGRLDDHAKKRIVELRKAGLSFRKIKKVLELDNIRVTPQAVYLFLKRKNVGPALIQPVSPPQAALEKRSQRLVPDQASWEGDQLWNLLQENESGQNEPRESAGNRLPGPSTGVGVSCGSDQDSIQIVSVTSLSKEGRLYGKQNAMPGGITVGLQPGQSIGDTCSVSGTSSAPMVPADVQHHLNGKGKACLPPARNPALIVKRKIVGRAIHLQKKANVQNGQNPPGPLSAQPFMLRVQPTTHPSRGTPPAPAASLGSSAHAKDASTQTPVLNVPYSAASPDSQWGGQTAALLAPTTFPQSLVDQLDTVHAEVQKLSQAVHLVLERQCRLERQQQQQQRFQQEVLVTLQQLSATIGHGAVAGNQPCAPYGNMADPSPPLPNFSHFKMELI